MKEGNQYPIILNDVVLNKIHSLTTNSGSEEVIHVFQYEV